MMPRRRKGEVGKIYLALGQESLGSRLIEGCFV